MTKTLLATLMVNKFHFRYNGKRFGPGAVIRNVPADLANKLVAEHPGNIVKLAEITEYAEDTAEKNNATNAGSDQVTQTEDSTVSESAEKAAAKPVEPPKEMVTEQEDDSLNASVAELPGVDPSATVAKTGKKK